jgi:NAD(P)-dependent dehydrogenase (short-subunit alcohol dehydrogenase family)
MIAKSQKRIFITGGASGLGEALAERYARASCAVCICDINESRGQAVLTKLKALGAEAHFLRADVTEIADLQRCADWMLANWGGVDTVVNNAGVAVGGSIDETPMDDWEWIININLLGVVRGFKVFTPLFKKQGHGQFISTASAAGLVHLPRMSAYNASKSAVVALSETMKLELASSNIRVSVVCPTFFKTNLVESLRCADPAARKAAGRLVTNSIRSADSIADVVYRQAERNRFLILPDREARAARYLKRFLPSFVFFRALARAEILSLKKAH